MKNDWNPEDASGGTVLDNLTRDRLMELESAPRTPMRLFCDYLICFLPVLAGCMALAMTPEEEDAAWKKEPAYGKTIRIGYNGGLCLGTFGIAQMKGFYEAEGLKTEITRYQGGSSAQGDAIGTGKIDVAGDHIATLLIPAVNGVRMKFTSGIHTGCKSLCVLNDGPIKSTKDLVGKTISVPDGIGASDQNITMRLLSRDGIDPVKDVKYKVVDSGASVLALQSGEIQAALLSDQFIQQFLDDGTLRVVRTITHDPDFKDECCCIHAVNLDFYENNPITVKKLTRAHEKAKEWILANREEAVKVLQENNWASGERDLVQKIFNTFNYAMTDAATEDTLVKVIDDYKSYGLLDKSASTKEILDKVWAPVLQGK